MNYTDADDASTEVVRYTVSADPDADPENQAQRPETLLGSMLRLDVDGGAPYAIPADNPFVDHVSYREETWAYGLRTHGGGPSIAPSTTTPWPPGAP